MTLSATPNQTHVNIASTIQVVLLYIPLVYLVVYTTTKLLHRAKKTKVAMALYLKCKGRERSTSKLDDYHQFSLNTAEKRLNIKAKQLSQL